MIDYKEIYNEMLNEIKEIVENVKSSLEKCNNNIEANMIYGLALGRLYILVEDKKNYND